MKHTIQMAADEEYTVDSESCNQFLNDQLLSALAIHYSYLLWINELPTNTLTNLHYNLGIPPHWTGDVIDTSEFDMFNFCTNLFSVCSATVVTAPTILYCNHLFQTIYFWFVQCYCCSKYKTSLRYTREHFLERTVRTALPCWCVVGLCVGEVTFLSGLFFSVPAWCSGDMLWTLLVPSRGRGALVLL